MGQHRKITTPRPHIGQRLADIFNSNKARSLARTSSTTLLPPLNDVYPDLRDTTGTRPAQVGQLVADVLNSNKSKLTTVGLRPPPGPVSVSPFIAPGAPDASVAPALIGLSKSTALATPEPPGEVTKAAWTPRKRARLAVHWDEDTQASRKRPASNAARVDSEDTPRVDSEDACVDSEDAHEDGGDNGWARARLASQTRDCLDADGIVAKRTGRHRMPEPEELNRVDQPASEVHATKGKKNALQVAQKSLPFPAVDEDALHRKLSATSCSVSQSKVKHKTRSALNSPSKPISRPTPKFKPSEEGEDSDDEIDFLSPRRPSSSLPARSVDRH
ncbi:hypothetical protein FA95DRAFT_1679251 [Auriscalpium vulgare]|uniref:Uncharacterized protein n=1 Tax=Auriscalpium vulgare TaxID=40419 RepID=A0ACB8RT48_9AGAM|nr:hypothetical protein FA95DRAFT_1679251 [Auriscalpium vulgare]